MIFIKCCIFCQHFVFNISENNTCTVRQVRIICDTVTYNFYYGGFSGTENSSSSPITSGFFLELTQSALKSAQHSSGIITKHQVWISILNSPNVRLYICTYVRMYVCHNFLGEQKSIKQSKISKYFD